MPCSSAACPFVQEREPLPLLPQDRLALLRTIPVLLAMLFPADAGTAGMDATGAKLLQRCLGMIKQKPVVAAYGDVPVALTTTLFQLSPFMAAFGGPMVCCTVTSLGLLHFCTALSLELHRQIAHKVFAGLCVFRGSPATGSLLTAVLAVVVTGPST